MVLLIAFSPQCGLFWALFPFPISKYIHAYNAMWHPYNSEFHDRAGWNKTNISFVPEKTIHVFVVHLRAHINCHTVAMLNCHVILLWICSIPELGLHSQAKVG